MYTKKQWGITVHDNRLIREQSVISIETRILGVVTDKVICRIRTNDPSDGSEDMANAKLIRAVPEMLVTLQEIAGSEVLDAMDFRQMARDVLLTIGLMEEERGGI